MAADATAPSLWRNGAFNLFWAGQTISSVGDAFTSVALPLLVLHLGGTVLSMTFVTAALGTGAIAAGILIGPIVDRVSRRNFLMACDIARALLMFAIPVSIAGGVFSFGLLGVVAFFLGFFGTAFGVAFVAFLPEVVDKTQLLGGNARLQSTFAFSFVIGPAIAGLTVARWGPSTAIAIDGMTFFASFIALVFVRPTRPAERAAPSAGRGRLVGLRFVLRTPVLRTLALVFFVQVLATEATLNLFTFYIKKRLGAGDATVGVAFGVASIGAVIASLAASWARRRLGLFASFLVTGVMLAAALALPLVHRSLEAVILAAVIFAFAQTVRGILSMTTRQEITPLPMLGRVTSVYWLILQVPRPVAALSMGVISQRWGLEAALTASVMLLAMMTIGTLGAHSFRQQPAAGAT